MDNNVGLVSSTKIINVGSFFVKLSKFLMWCAVVGLVGLIIVLLGGHLSYFVLAGYYEEINVLVAIFYLMVVAGFTAIPWYLIGHICIGVGIIAENTQK